MCFWSVCIMIAVDFSYMSFKSWRSNAFLKIMCLGNFEEKVILQLERRCLGWKQDESL